MEAMEVLDRIYIRTSMYTIYFFLAACIARSPKL
jgi:hypothetical protein